MSNYDTPAAPTRPPLSAELLAQATKIESGVSFSLTPHNTISAKHTSDDNRVIVTWRGPEWKEDEVMG